MKIDTVQKDNVYFNIANGKDTSKEHRTSSEQNKQSSNVIFAGNLNINDDIVGQKKNQAARQALKTLISQHNNDNKTDDQVSSLQDKRRKLLDDADLAADQVKNLKASNAELKNSYGIESGSTEQKNLDLLEKSIYSPEKLTAEDRTQLKNMGPLTDYQKDALKNDAMKNIWQERVNGAKDDVFNIDRTINSIALERLKTHPMVDAQKEAAQILEEASKEVVATLLQDVKENVDKTMQENKEAVQKEQEEQDKKDAAAGQTDQTGKSEQSGKANQSGLSISEQTNQLQFADQLKQIAKKQNLMGDDVKGIVVDQKL